MQKTSPIINQQMISIPMIEMGEPQPTYLSRSLVLHSLILSLEKRATLDTGVAALVAGDVVQAVDRHYGLQSPPTAQRPEASKSLQPMIGRLLDEFAALPVLWGLKEPGALVRHGQVFDMMVKVAKEYAAATQSVQETAPVAGQEPVKLDTDQSREYLVRFMEQHFTDKTYHRYIRGAREKNNLAGDFAWQMARALRMITAPVASAPPAQITLTGHQLRIALDLINPDGPSDRDQLDDDLTFGVRQHQDDDGTVSTGMCCWNDDTDGVLPLDGEYEAPKEPRK